MAVGACMAGAIMRVRASSTAPGCSHSPPMRAGALKRAQPSTRSSPCSCCTSMLPAAAEKVEGRGVAAEGADINKAGGCCWGGCPAARPTPTHPPLHHQHESLPAPTSKEQDSIDGHHAALPHKHFAGLHNLRVGQPAALKLAALEVDGGGVQEDAACGRRAGG